MLGKIFRERVENPIAIHIIAVEPCNNLPGCTLKALIQSMRLPLIGLTHPIGQVVLIFLDNLDAAIGTPTVNNDVLQVGIFLA